MSIFSLDEEILIRENKLNYFVFILNLQLGNPCIIKDRLLKRISGPISAESLIRFLNKE